MDNRLFLGDNLDILRRHVKNDSVDLIYLDPPFKSNKAYNVIFKEKNGAQSGSQIEAFKDTWSWDKSSAEAFEEIVVSGPDDVSRLMQALRQFLGASDMMAYLAMMAPRLLELRRVLKDTGSIYLHCDPTASHYLKLLMDAVFGRERFLNEIVWSYEAGGRSKRHFGRKHDTILLYGASSRHYFNGNAVRIEMKAGKTSFGGRLREDESGRKYREVWGTGRKKLYRYYLDEGKVPEDVWQMPSIQSQDRERLGYPTQKPEALLERIVKASSGPGDVVLEPFCGCGTAIVVAERLGRNWIGIDVTPLAINAVRSRLQQAFGPDGWYDVDGLPKTLPDAEKLAEEDRYKFELWALGLAGASEQRHKKKGADKDIDGRLYFYDEGPNAQTKQIVVQVKSGHVVPSQIRDLVGVLDRENAQIGAFITLHQPTQKMQEEAAAAGFYMSPVFQKKYPRIQILTIEALLAGSRIDYPAGTTHVGKQARRSRAQARQRDIQAGTEGEESD
ncbi:MAG: restriction endonuclease [Candidatus Coatesbacteria bacterium]|nr:restriction endonuclease [Candidatus Coatesbacteria bacterium]